MDMDEEAIAQDIPSVPELLGDSPEIPHKTLTTENFTLERTRKPDGIWNYKYHKHLKHSGIT